MGHQELTEIAKKWVLKQKWSIAAVEQKSCAAEIPDVIGFSSSDSVVVECKASRADFKADAKKPWRIYSAEGMGKYRFYLCPEGLIKPEELPNNWGLIYVGKRGKTEVVVNPYCAYVNGNIYSNGFYRYNKEAERQIMYALLRANIN